MNRSKWMAPRRSAGVVAGVSGLLSMAVAMAVTAPSTALAQVGEKVVLDGYAIDATEVTVAQFRQHSPGAPTRTRAEKDGGGFEYDGGWQQRPGWHWAAPYGSPASDNEPAVHVTWHEARAYCKAVGGELPTAAQWRRAAYEEMRREPTDGYQRGVRYRYPVGQEPAGMNTSAADPWPRHAPAGVTRRGVNGLYDMGANAWEWLSDSDGDRALTAGGSWWYGPSKTQTDGLQYKPRDFAAVYIGFRCVYR